MPIWKNTFALRFESKANEGTGLRQIASQNMGSKKTSKKLLQKLGFRKANDVHLHPLWKAGQEREKRRSWNAKKSLEKRWKKFCGSPLNVYLCCPADNLNKRVAEKRKGLKPKGFDQQECQFNRIENTVEKCLNEEGCRAWSLRIRRPKSSLTQWELR